MKNRYLNLSKLSEKQLEHVFSLLPVLGEDDYLNSYDIDETHYCLVWFENSGKYAVVSWEYVSFNRLESVDYSSFCSLCGTDVIKN